MLINGARERRVLGISGSNGTVYSREKAASRRDNAAARTTADYRLKNSIGRGKLGGNNSPLATTWWVTTSIAAGDHSAEWTSADSFGVKDCQFQEEEPLEDLTWQQKQKQIVEATICQQQHESIVLAPRIFLLTNSKHWRIQLLGSKNNGGHWRPRLLTCKGGNRIPTASHHREVGN